MKILNIHYGPYIKPPTDEAMLNHEIIEHNEAAFWVTDWPGKLYTCACKEALQDKGISRTFLYLPGHYPEDQREAANPYTFSQESNDMRKAIVHAIKSGELEARGEVLCIHEAYDERISYFLAPKDILNWMLDRGYYLPERIQKTVGIYLQQPFGGSKKIEAAFVKKVRIKVTGQLLYYYYPKRRGIFYCNHEWMRPYIPKGDPNDKHRVIRNALNELKGPKYNYGKRMISQDDIEAEKYNPRAIPEVVFEERSGIRRYNMIALRLAMTTAANILLQQYNRFFFQEVPTKASEELNMMQDLQLLHQNPRCELLEHLMQHEVVSLYIRGASPMLLERIGSYFENIIYDNFAFMEPHSVPI